MLEGGTPGSPRVVLVPGATGSKEDFNLILPELAAAGYHAQSYDLAGQYESHRAGPGDGGRYDYDLFVNDLIAFLEAGQPAHLLGYSFAGAVAQLVVAQRPELVRSLTLLGAPPHPGNGFLSMKAIGWLSAITSDHTGAGLMIWGIRTNKNRVPPKRLEFVQSRFALTRRESVDDIIGLMKRTPDVRRHVRDSGIPTLIAVGQHDLWPVQRQREAAEALGAQLRVYQTGHSPCETTPYQLTEHLLELFAKAED